ncbi:hypothetical protein A0H76_3057, partial [Hepatospora eriocheir]
MFYFVQVLYLNLLLSTSTVDILNEDIKNLDNELEQFINDDSNPINKNNNDDSKDNDIEFIRNIIKSESFFNFLIIDLYDDVYKKERLDCSLKTLLSLIQQDILLFNLSYSIVKNGNFYADKELNTCLDFIIEKTMLVDYSVIVSCLFKNIETYLNQQNFTKELNKVTKLEHTDLLKEKDEFCKFLTKSVMNEFLVNYVKKFEINRSLIFLTESYNINNNEKLNVLKSEVDKISETYIKYVIDQCIYNERTNNDSMLDDIEKNHDRKFPYVIKLEDDLRKKLADGFKNFKTKLSNNCK